MSNTHTAATSGDAVPYSKMFNHDRLRHIIDAHQSLSDYYGVMAHIYNPLVYAPPKAVNPPTTTEKKMLERMLIREMEMMWKIRRLIAEMEESCNELCNEINPTRWRNTGWADTTQNQNNGNDNFEGGDDQDTN